MYTALGISDEVDKFAMKGNKKKKGRKLDEDYMVSVTFVLAFTALSHLLAPTAYIEANRGEGRPEGRSSHAADTKPQGAVQTLDPCQGALLPSVLRIYLTCLSTDHRGPICPPPTDATAWLQYHDEHPRRLHERLGHNISG